LADVYSCSGPDCVQLRDPAEELLLRFPLGFAFTDFGEYFIISGVSMVFSLLAAEYKAPDTTLYVVLGSECLFFFGFSFLLVRGVANRSDLTIIALRLLAHSCSIEYIPIPVAGFWSLLTRLSKGFLLTSSFTREGDDLLVKLLHMSSAQFARVAWVCVVGFILMEIDIYFGFHLGFCF
jgi:hypothetical protein